MKTRSRALAAVSAAGACMLALVATADASHRTTHSTLRVEGLGKTLDPGTNYSNRSITTKNSNRCGDRDSETSV